MLPFSTTAPCILTISLSALRANYRQFKAMTTADVAGILKADAYGTGAAPAFAALREEGCRRFFVATPEEGAALAAHPSAHETCEIYVLGGVYRGAEDFYLHNGLIPVLNGPDDFERWDALARKTGYRLPAALHLDTGMNRLGFENAPAPEDFEALGLKLVMSHFSSSDEAGHPANARQAQAFAAHAAGFGDVPKSLANSSGLFRNKSWHYDLVRPGYALYGGNPLPEGANPVKPVVTLETRVLQTRAAKKGSAAGYGESHVFKQDTTLATVACGYADGFLRSGSNKARLYWNGQPCPVRGRISMDLIIVETGHLNAPPREGDWLEILGTHQGVDDLARETGTIGYEILTSLGARHHRVYES